MNRYFTDSRNSWTWDGRKMRLDGNGHVDSIFDGPDDILGCTNVHETDECGIRLAESAEDIAAAKGDHEQQIAADLS